MTSQNDVDKNNLFELIQKVTERINLNPDESESAFTYLEKSNIDGFLFYAFLAALETKGMTSDELVGFCSTAANFIPRINVSSSADDIIDVSGTGGDKIKTFNASTAAAFILASAGIKVAKQAFLAVTGVTGSADLLQHFGADPLALSRKGTASVKAIFERAGMVLYHANSLCSPDARRGYFKFWFEHVPKAGMPFVTAYHLAANAYSAIPIKRRVYGVFSVKYLHPLTELFQKLGYEKGIVCHGNDGIDEFSNVGNTTVIEFTKNNLREYIITPQEMGVRCADVEEIVSHDAKGNIRDFLRIIYNVDNSAKKDLALVNAAAGLYVMGKVKTLKEGVGLAQMLLNTGKVEQKFDEYIAICGDINKLNEAKKAADIYS